MAVYVPNEPWIGLYLFLSPTVRHNLQAVR